MEYLETPRLNPDAADGDAFDSFARMLQGISEGADRTLRRESVDYSAIVPRDLSLEDELAQTGEDPYALPPPPPPPPPSPAAAKTSTEAAAAPATTPPKRRDGARRVLPPRAAHRGGGMRALLPELDATAEDAVRRTRAAAAPRYRDRRRRRRRPPRPGRPRVRVRVPLRRGRDGQVRGPRAPSRPRHRDGPIR